LEPRPRARGFFVSLCIGGYGGSVALMRINIWMVLAVLLALSPLGFCNISNKRTAADDLARSRGVQKMMG
jgi:hypothetical protein